ncbi:hypothetical protein ncot_15280 [Nocardioides sp. JQ2195]|uniref:hypothetical protein n=1 Tax=Nocardioides sp. JQ2195 TaxID=2592334 RepID=UPI00143E2C3D|nr:hypothetical protein [Nocardioides sp. JQ2195]QIX27802.1 hypothetical protein ncot_15280 [Nocardioides sp. JQ2195]
MTDREQVQQAIVDAEQARTEHRKLGERLALLDQQVARAEQSVARARARLVDERADVAKLESFSTTRIMAALRGDRSERIEREKAEQQAAEYAVATEEAGLAQVRAERDHLAARRTSLGDVDGSWERALAAKEQWLTTVDPAAGGEAADLSSRIGRGTAQLKELGEAQQAHGRAVAQLTAAAGFLGSARSWSTYDAWFDGGFVGDLAKHQKMDEASARMRAADVALRQLATELADVSMAPVGGLGVTDLTKTFDIWFDNIFTDFAVRNRIIESIDRVNAALHALGGIGQQLAGRRIETEQEIGRCRNEREALLRG